MDDLTMLRDLGHELEHEPPATLVRHRRRLLDAAAGNQAGFRRIRPPLRGWPMLALVGAVTAALIITPTALLTAKRSGAPHPAGTGAPATGPARPVNVLVLGSDSRGGGDRRQPAGSARADTLMILHLPADRRSATLLSIPRDTMVAFPACRAPDGGPALVRTAPIGTAYAYGGFDCTLKAVEALTGAPMDHGMVIDFVGFRKMVDALGGVELTIPKAVSDPKAHLRLRAGRQVLDGETALGYVRARREFGDGSDLDRIRRQQQFMAALAVRARERLSDPRRLVAFLDTVSASVRAHRLDAETALSIARSLKDVPVGALRTVVLPVGPHPADPNRLAVDRAAAERHFAELRRR